jgi:CDP-glucose 4,6-dehydratase
MFAEALKSQNGPVLITGHTGFKGTWLSLLLDYLTIEHYGFALEAESGSLFDRLELRNLFPGIIGDIRNLDALISSFSKIKPAIVVHMAAQPLVLKAYEEPLETFEVNVLGTANVIKTAFATPSVKIVLVITTDKVYKNDDSGRRFRESDSLSGKDPYSASKVGAEAVCAAWQQISRTYGGPKVIVARAGNVIGGGDFAADRIIPDIIRGVISNKPTLVRNPNSTRPWQHVLDPILGYLLFIESTLREETNVDALNFGPSERSLEVRRILDIGQEILGSRIKYIFSEETSNREAATLELDSSLANQELLWLPKWSQEEALKRTFTWWKSVIEGQKSAYYNCIHDIEEVLAQGN